MGKSKDTDINNAKSNYITLDRSIMSHWIADKGDTLKRWIDIIMMANYESKYIMINNSKVFVPRGSFVRSQVKLASRWMVDREVARNFLKKLVRENMIEIESTKFYTMITVCNYDTYQLIKPTKNPTKTHTEPTTNPTETTSKKGKKEKSNLIIYYFNEIENLKAKYKNLAEGGGAKNELDSDVNILSSKLRAENDEVTNIIMPQLLDAYSYIKNEHILKQKQQDQEQIFPSLPLPEVPIEIPVKNTSVKHNKGNWYDIENIGDLQNELINSNKWHEDVLTYLEIKKEIKLTLENLVGKIPDFIVKLIENDEFPLELHKTKTYFRNWVAYNQKTKTNNNTNNTNTNGNEKNKTYRRSTSSKPQQPSYNGFGEGF